MLMTAIAMLAAGAAPATTAATNVDNQVVCHREEVTGSLVGARRVCHTRAEWRALGDAASREAEKIVDQGLIRPTTGG